MNGAGCVLADVEVHDHGIIYPIGIDEDGVDGVGSCKCHAAPVKRQFVVTDGCVNVVAHKDLYGVPNTIELFKGDVIQSEVVAAARCVLVDDGDGGLRVVAAVPNLVEVLPGVGGRIAGWCGEDVADLHTVDAELQLRPRTFRHSGHPRGEGVIGVGDDVYGLGPYNRAGIGGTIDDHIVSIAGGVVVCAGKSCVIVVRISAYIVCPFRPKVRCIRVTAGESGIPLGKIAVCDKVAAGPIACDDEVHRLLHRRGRGSGRIGALHDVRNVG